MEMPFQLLITPLHFMADPVAEAPAWLRDANQAILDADGFVIVSTEYNCGIPPALSNMMDHFPPASFRHRPCGLVIYSMGHSGGARVLTLLRIFVAEFGMYPLPTHVVIPLVHEVLTEDGADTSQSGRFRVNVEKQAYELEWLADAILNQKKISKPTEHGFVFKSYDDPVKVKSKETPAGSDSKEHSNNRYQNELK